MQVSRRLSLGVRHLGLGLRVSGVFVAGEGSGNALADPDSRHWCLEQMLHARIQNVRTPHPGDG